MVRVLFVCLGNICRSPMADGVFQDMVKKAGLADKISVDSAGTGSWHVGERAHQGTLRTFKKHSIEYNGRARQLQRSDFDEFDYVLAMDRSNLANMLPLQRTPDSPEADDQAEVALFLSYANEQGLLDVTEVPDPYYDNNFEYVYSLVDTGCKALLAHIREKHDL